MNAKSREWQRVEEATFDCSLIHKDLPVIEEVSKKPFFKSKKKENRSNVDFFRQ